MPTLYEALLFLHIVAAIAWIGGAIMHVVLMAMRVAHGIEHVAKLDLLVLSSRPST